MTPPRPTTPSGRQLVAVATAAIPVVMLSSLALASPATAASAKAEMMPHGNHGALDGQKVLAAVKAHTGASSIPASVVASSVPRAVTAMSPGANISSVRTQLSALTSHTVVSGDTISGIAASYGVSTESLLSRNNISASELIHPGKVLSISGPDMTDSSDQASVGTTAANYTVRAGETLSGIAAEHGLSLATVFSLNGLDGNSVIHPGQELKVGSAAEAAAPSETIQQADAPAPSSYIIKAGDTLSSIAAQHNVALSALAAANDTELNAPIYAGKTLVIPGLNAASSSITPIVTPAQAPPELTPDQQVPSTFLHYTYPDAVVSDANQNKAALLAAPSPSRAQMKDLVANTAASMGVDPALAMAFAQQESGFNHQSVSPANAIGTMQVIPDAGEWASGLVGRELNLLDPQDNVTAGVAIIRALHQGAENEDQAIAGYYQGQYSVSVHALFSDTEIYVAGIKANRELFR